MFKTFDVSFRGARNDMSAIGFHRSELPKALAQVSDRMMQIVWVDSCGKDSIISPGRDHNVCQTGLAT
jgi:hypothetical protein